MIVFIAGMQRSGSTLSFNIAREILSYSGKIYAKPHLGIDKIIEAAKNENADHIIVKAHDVSSEDMELIKNGTVHTICTFRDPQDAIESWMQVFGFSFEESVEAMKNWLLAYEKLKPYCLSISFREIESRPWLVANRIYYYLLKRINPIISYKISKKYNKEAIYLKTHNMAQDTINNQDIGFSYYNKETFFHRNHVRHFNQKANEKFFNAKQIKYIEEIIGDKSKILGIKSP